MRIRSCPQTEIDASLIPCLNVITKGQIQFLLDLRVLCPVPLHKPEQLLLVLWPKIAPIS